MHYHKSRRTESEVIYMYKRTEANESVQPRFLGIEEFMTYTSLGRTSAMRLGKEIGCTMRVGRRILYDTRKADQYINSLTGVK